MVSRLVNGRRIHGGIWIEDRFLKRSFEPLVAGIFSRGGLHDINMVRAHRVEITIAKSSRTFIRHHNHAVGWKFTRELPTRIQEELPTVEDLQEVVNKLRTEMEILRKDFPEQE